jgi:hypothetical protein
MNSSLRWRPGSHEIPRNYITVFWGDLMQTLEKDTAQRNIIVNSCDSSYSGNIIEHLKHQYISSCKLLSQILSYSNKLLKLSYSNYSITNNYEIFIIQQ